LEFRFGLTVLLRDAFWLAQKKSKPKVQTVTPKAKPEPKVQTKILKSKIEFGVTVGLLVLISRHVHPS
jgi:hypothetical protein